MKVTNLINSKILMGHPMGRSTPLLGNTHLFTQKLMLLFNSKFMAIHLQKKILSINSSLAFHSVTSIRITVLP